MAQEQLATSSACSISSSCPHGSFRSTTGSNPLVLKALLAGASGAPWLASGCKKRHPSAPAVSPSALDASQSVCRRFESSRVHRSTSPERANAAADQHQPGWRSKAAVSNCWVWARMRSISALAGAWSWSESARTSSHIAQRMRAVRSGSTSRIVCASIASRSASLMRAISSLVRPSTSLATSLVACAPLGAPVMGTLNSRK